MKILLTGASGFIGKHIAMGLESAGHSVLAADRNSGFDFKRMVEESDWLPHLHGVEAVINSVGIIVESRGQTFETIHHQAPVALFRACEHAGVKRVIQISALGADERAYTPYQQSKNAADDVLRSLALDWFVLCPSLVYGPGGKSVAMFQRMASLPVIPLVAQGLQWIQPVHVDDLVAAVLQCLITSPTRRTINIVGPYPITLVNWLQQMRKVSGKATAPSVSIPFGLAMATARIARYVVPIMHPDNLYMLQQGNTAEVDDFAQLLGRMPVSIEDAELGLIECCTSV